METLVASAGPPWDPLPIPIGELVDAIADPVDLAQGVPKRG
jgi:hypothetical protein